MRSIHSATMPLSQVDEFAQTLIAQRVSMVTGVAQVGVIGSQKYAVRVQLDPSALMSRQIGIGTQTDDTDGTWIQNAGSTLKVGIDTAGVTKIFIDDTLDVTGTSATTAQVTALGLGPSWKWRTAPSRTTASPLLRAWTRLSDPSASSPREPMRN